MSNKETQGVAAVGFVVLAFKDEKAGDEALKVMKEAKKQKKFYFEEAAVIRQDANGKVHYQETGDMKAGKGAGAGAVIGGILGVLGGPGGIALGASAGAALGAAATHGDAGFRDESLKTVGTALKPGTSAVTAITSSAFLKALRKEIPVENIRSFVSRLAAEISARLDEGKNVGLGIILAGDGLAFKEIAVDEHAAEVTGLVITDEGVLAGGAVVTEEQLNYGVVAVTEEGAVMEAGVVTKEGALIVDDVITAEGEAVVATAILPEEATPETPAEEGKPAETGDAEATQSAA